MKYFIDQFQLFFFVFAWATLNISSVAQCPPTRWKVRCSIHGHWV